MNILHIRASNFYGGPERQLHLHAREALGSKYSITVCSFSEKGNVPEFIRTISGDYIKTHTYKVKSAYDMASYKLVRDDLKDNKIDILCTHDYRSHFIGWLASRKLKTRWFAFSRGWTRENLKIKFYQVLDKIIVRFADIIIAVSEAQKQKLLKLMIAPEKIRVVHNSIDVDYFADIEPIDLKKRFDLPADSIVCVSGGRFSPEKGQKYLVDAASQLIKTENKVRFILFGDGPDLSAIRERINHLELNKYVKCPGFEKNMIGCIKGADILINPSLSEGLPNIVLEAMALKTPVVATDVGGVSEIIADGESGLLVEPSSSSQICDALKRLIEQNNLTENIIHNGFEVVKNGFSFKGQFNKLAEIYEKFGNN